MDKKLNVSILLIFLTIISSSIVMAAEDQLPLWFKLMEPLGILIGIVALTIFYNNFKKFGGVIGKSFEYLIGTIILFILAFTWRSLMEFRIISESFRNEIIFELFLYAGIILIAISSSVAMKGFKE